VAAAGAHVIRQGSVVDLFNTVLVGFQGRGTPHPTTPEPDKSLNRFNRRTDAPTVMVAGGFSSSSRCLFVMPGEGPCESG
ncbi:hypothetical protein, partial [Rhodopila globiformis]|uniref:hypothetical protein n=1 Tax=Rhodopila globiformis TaxID=1071 RepID=UPI00195C7250